MINTPTAHSGGFLMQKNNFKKVVSFPQLLHILYYTNILGVVFMNKYKIYYNDGSTLTLTATNESQARRKAHIERPQQAIQRVVYMGV